MEIQKWPKETAKKHKFYDIYKLGHHLLQKFFGHFKERGEVIFCELLFLKSQKECTDIELGYGTYEYVEFRRFVCVNTGLDNKFSDILT
jgi:hypothetical protein